MSSVRDASTNPPASTEFTVTLSEEERTELLAWLEQQLRTKRVEEHRTEAADYRNYVRQQQQILETLIQKLRRH